MDKTCTVAVTFSEVNLAFFSFNRFRLSLLPVSMSEDNEGLVYLKI